jgi:ATP-dependent DNA helicase RecQ
MNDPALALLHAMAGPDAEFRDGQREAIEALARDRRRVLLVQRTGFGKSAVYFIATSLLRQSGSGPTLLLSPLLALMRNQIDMAARVGVRAETINSTNPDDWPAVEEALARDEIDVLLISPERLANSQFRERVLDSVAPRVGLVVIDEVHCISDWGHDFRPDYRRIRRILDALPRGIPVLGTTATANDRVVQDVQDQLGSELLTIRGPLGREGLRLAIAPLWSAPERLAWVADRIPHYQGSGIVYCLTVRDAHLVAEWLVSRGIDAVAYTGGTDNDERLEVEDRLLANEVKVVVATSALGMGYDKPDLSFVVHYQTPGNAVAYYQQVGRAGRALPSSRGILLHGSEDEDIQDYFINMAFPSPELTDELLSLLETADEPVRPTRIESELNIGHTRLENALKNLEVDGAVLKDGPGWTRTARPWTYPHERVAEVTAARRVEQEQMRQYGTCGSCLMQFLRQHLDDPDPEACGVCMTCRGLELPSPPDDLVDLARTFVRGQVLVIEPRRRWPVGVDHPLGKLDAAHIVEAGRALSRYDDLGWGRLVKTGKHDTGQFDDELVAASARLIRQWQPDPAPAWITWIPSLRRPELVADFARRLAAVLSVPAVEAVHPVRESQPQNEMRNSAQQLLNVVEVFEVKGTIPSGPVLLVDDLVDSRWTLTTVGWRLRDAGSGPVHPFALSDSAGG